LPQQLRHLRGPAALATILAAIATTHRHVYPASAADRDGYTDGHCHTCSWHSHPNTYRCARRHAHIHRHSSGAAHGYANPAAATTHGDADADPAATTAHGYADADPAATTAHGYADPATAAAYGYTDPATTTTYGYTATAATYGYVATPAATADRYAATATDEHTCSVSHSDSDR
jgi:hypothetical protein